MVGKDPRRLFTSRQRFDLWLAANGCCEHCGCQLEDEWHAHHVERHHVGGKTNIWNAQALCIECHQREHSMDRHDDIHGDRHDEPAQEDGTDNASPRANPVGSAFRKDYSWQDRAVEKFINEKDDFYSAVPGQFRHAYAVEVSPSGGKTKFSMKAAKAGIEAGLFDKVFFVVPRDTIKDGFKRDAAEIEMAEDFRLGGQKCIQIDTSLKNSYVGSLKNFHGAVVNYQSLRRFAAYLELLAGRRLRILVVFDELHHGSVGEFDSDTEDEQAAWGKAMEAVRSFACAVIGMSGTPVRSDGEQVAYLRYEVGEKVDPLSGQHIPCRFVAPDFRFTYKNAIEAGLARKLLFRPQNPRISYRIIDKDGEIIDEADQIELRFVLHAHLDRAKKELFSPDNGHIDEMLDVAFFENNLDRSVGDDEAAILVVVGSTDQTGYNPLEYVAGRIAAKFGETPVTVKSADGDEARDAIKAFSEDKCTARWIVAKDMISEGTNIPRIRTILILKDIKSHVKFEQTVHRATRNRSNDYPQDAKVIFYWLPEMFAFAQAIEDDIRFIDEKTREKPKCGQCKTELEFYPSQMRPCPVCGYVPPPKPLQQDTMEWLDSIFGAEDVVQGGASGWKKYDDVNRKVQSRIGVPGLIRTFLNEWLKDADDNGEVEVKDATAQPQAKAFTDEEEIQRFREQGNDALKSAAHVIHRGTGDDYQVTIKELTRQCKRVAGVGTDNFETVLREYPNPKEHFRKYKEAAQEALRRARAKHGA